MADNNNPRTNSAQNAMMAEIIVAELEKFTDTHQTILEKTEKITESHNRLFEIVKLMYESYEDSTKAIKDLAKIRDSYSELTKLSMRMGEELKSIDEEGIGIEPDSLNKVIKAVQYANKPIREHIRWLTYGVITAFGMLLLIGLLL